MPDARRSLDEAIERSHQPAPAESLPGTVEETAAGVGWIFGVESAAQRNIGDDGPYVFKACAHCHAYVQLAAIADYCDDGYTADDVREYEPNNMTEARWRAQQRRKWTRRDGDLYPVPEVSP